MKKTGHLQLLLQELIAGCAAHFVTLAFSLAAAICEAQASRVFASIAISALVVSTVKTGIAGRKLKLVAHAIYASK
jgi:hypothetical protein